MVSKISYSQLQLLTSLRFFAAAEVVIFHHRQMLPISSEFTLGLVSGGYEAVTFFFILSGFILTHAYSGSSTADTISMPATQFWRARIARIAPAYFLGLVLMLPDYANQSLLLGQIPTTTFILGLILVPSFLQAWWPPTTFLWNSPAWSLSVEALFYALFPALVYLSRKFGRTPLIFLTFSLVIATNVLPILVTGGMQVSKFTETIIGYFPLMHLPQFIFGIALYRLFEGEQKLSNFIHAVLFLVAVVATIVMFGSRNQLPAWSQTNGILTIFFSIVIFCGARADPLLWWFKHPFLILLGEASYSIYILHMPVSFWWLWLKNQLGLELSGYPSFFIYVFLTLVISLLSFYYVEQPLRKWFVQGAKMDRGTVP